MCQDVTAECQCDAICESCHGEGGDYRSCPMCDGDGDIPLRHADDGDYTETCRYCEGAKDIWEECKICEGTGKAIP